MKIFSVDQIRKADAYTIDHEPIPGIDLMERASQQFTNWFHSKYRTSTNVYIFVGPGNNGGDGLAVARKLSSLGYEVKVFIPEIIAHFSPDAGVNLERLKKTEVGIYSLNGENFPQLDDKAVIIDALFGSGLSRSLSGFYKSLVLAINGCGKPVIAIDIPSGLFADDNSNNDHEAIIKAQFTVTFQFPKYTFFMPEAEEYTGLWKVVSIGLHQEYIQNTVTKNYFLEESHIASLIKTRKKHTHKGTFGHGLLIAGSYGMFGAAVLASKAALRAGVGLLTCHLPRAGYPILQTSVPEAMVSIDESDIIFTENPTLDKFSAVAAGPGLGTKPNTVKAISHLLDEINVPIIFDADAINVLATNRELLDKIPENTILTPHPKEFSRLLGENGSRDQQIAQARIFASQYKVYIVLKGANTVIVTPETDVWFNTTGNPGLATAGSGDVLTGLVLGVLSQGYSPLEALKISVYCHGLAGDIFVTENSQESLISSDLVEYFGKALKKIRANEVS